MFSTIALVLRNPSSLLMTRTPWGVDPSGDAIMPGDARGGHSRGNEPPAAPGTACWGRG